jgi:two-component system, OmpR family, response regulator MprA
MDVDTTPAKILFAEDDRSVRESVALALELEGYAVTAVNDGAAALDAVGPVAPDLMIFDVSMPHLDGLSACRRLRSLGNRTPLLMLTARTEVQDRVSGLDAGADDYLTKPFALDELLARVRALLRRSLTEGAIDVLVLGDLTMDLASRRVLRGDQEIELSKTEFDLLELLLENQGRVLSQSTIYDRIWGYDFGANSKNLAVYIGYLRRKLDEEHLGKLIHTVRGVGYTARLP